jgi:dihydroxy-acid dehydratase
VVGHVVPEAQVGGPIALVQDGDIITIDAEGNTLDVNVSEEEFAKRKSNWVAPPLRPKQGALLKYARNVTDASRGCGEYLSSLASTILTGISYRLVNGVLAACIGRR